MENKKCFRISEIWIFVICCILCTALLVFLEKILMGEAAGTGVFLSLACFVPAFTAVIISLRKKYKITELCIFPNLRPNIGKYILFFSAGLLLSLLETPVTALIYPEQYNFDDFSVTFFMGRLMVLVTSGLVSAFNFLGEEIGWLGYLLPRLEKKYGLVLGTMIMALIRGAWHLAMFVFIYDLKEALVSTLMIFLYNLFTDSLLVYSYKRTHSVIPGAMIHGLTGAVSGVYAVYMVSDEALAGSSGIGAQLVGMLPAVLVGIIFYCLLHRMTKRIKTLDTSCRLP